MGCYADYKAHVVPAATTWRSTKCGLGTYDAEDMMLTVGLVAGVVVPGAELVVPGLLYLPPLSPPGALSIAEGTSGQSPLPPNP